MYLRDDEVPPEAAVLELYRANDWSSADNPARLMAALRGSHRVVSAWDESRDEDRLIGLGNALSDGALVVYYPHLLVHPDFHGKGVGRTILRHLQRHYDGFHQQVLLAEAEAVGFYVRQGFDLAIRTRPMWIFRGGDR